MKNGFDPSLKAVKVGSKSVALTNTCAFDSACQIFAAVYSDSLKYKEKLLNNYDVSNAILEVVSHIATTGVNARAYRNRAPASVLAKWAKTECLQQGFVKIDCATDSSYLLRNLNIPPSMEEKYHCSSPHCSSPKSFRKIGVTSVTVSKNLDECMKNLVSYVLGGDCDDTRSRLIICPMSLLSHRICFKRS